MNEEKDFFSPNHKRLLSIAAWAKHIAWVVLVVYILLSAIEIIRFQNNVEASQKFGGNVPNNPLDIFRLVVNIAALALKGVVYYLVLKGISLGLNMIVETDINYREQKEDAQ